MRVIGHARFTYATEEQLQLGIATSLHHYGIAFKREFRLNAADRIDFLIGSIGIEIKIAGNSESVLRQLTRYSASAAISELILVTSKASHRALPEFVGGKSLTVIQLSGLR